MKKKANITLDDKLLEIIDKKRGDIPRSTFINNLLLLSMKGGVKYEENI